MKQDKSKSRLCIVSLFVILITYCTVCLYYEFSYLDLGYLGVVVVSFVRFLFLREIR